MARRCTIYIRAPYQSRYSYFRASTFGGTNGARKAWLGSFSRSPFRLCEVPVGVGLFCPSRCVQHRPNSAALDVVLRPRVLEDLPGLPTNSHVHRRDSSPSADESPNHSPRSINQSSPSSSPSFNTESTRFGT